MERRSFLKQAGSGAAVLGAVAAPAVVHAQANIRWRLASSFPKSLDTIFGAAEVFSKQVSAMTGGKFTISIHAAGELVPAFGVVDAIQNGTVEAGHTAPYYFFGKDETFAIGAAIPFGLVGVVLGLSITRTHFGFMAFLGVASLIGVIVSHIIVLFDFIEEARERGQPLHRAVIDAGLVRLRPVLVTVLATVGGLLPLGLEGGPMWRQLVYVQIGGLLLATVVTKGVVPLLYVVFVETFHLVEWRADHVDDLPPG